MKWKNIRTKNNATFLTKTIHLFVLWFVYFLKRCIESNFRGKYPISEPCISNSIKLLSFSEIVGRINHKILYLVIVYEGNKDHKCEYCANSFTHARSSGPESRPIVHKVRSTLST